MSRQLTTDDARLSLKDHVATKGAEIFAQYGPHIGWEQLQSILADRKCTRYPCRIVFGTGSLQPGEFAFPAQLGETPEDGFTMFVHSRFAARFDEVPLLVLYQLVMVNYGVFASEEDAEIFASSALGMDREEYYSRLCALADEVAPQGQTTSCGTGCGCSS